MKKCMAKASEWVGGGGGEGGECLSGDEKN